MQRKPFVAERSSAGCAHASLNEYSGSFQPPPSRKRLPSPVAFHAHSRTLPARSRTPKRFVLFVEPTRTSPRPARFACAMIWALAHVNATRFQWKIVGRLFSAHAAYAAASYQLTPVTGRSSSPVAYVPASQPAG